MVLNSAFESNNTYEKHEKKNAETQELFVSTRIVYVSFDFLKNPCSYPIQENAMTQQAPPCKLNFC